MFSCCAPWARRTDAQSSEEVGDEPDQLWRTAGGPARIVQVRNALQRGQANLLEREDSERR